METKIMASGAVVLTDELKKFIEEKLEKVTVLVGADDTAAMVDVEIGTTTGGQKTGDIFRAEINLQFSGGMIRAEAVRDTLHGAVDEAVSEARRELRKSKGKRRDLIRRGATTVKNFFRGFGGKGGDEV
jgi:ribosomal subunit interface protein